MIKRLEILFESGKKIYYNFEFSDQGTIRDIGLKKIIQMDWISLDYCKCTHCTIPSKPYAICPVAAILAQYAVELAEYPSYLEVDVKIYESDRTTYIPKMPMQKIVGELVRLAVFHTHCPIGVNLKPTMKNLRPFPDNDEIIRAFVTFFAICGVSEDIDLTPEQEAFVDSLHDLFSHLSRRLQSFGQGDAHLNGVIIVDTISMMFRLSSSELLRQTLEEIREGILPYSSNPTED
ncbi:MAG: hypothetical protein U9O87_05630 [Verrucomicrobiota bacterium]|nr:hypothetical protein [Verrucomicrobiota bacterium]